MFFFKKTKISMYIVPENPSAAAHEVKDGVLLGRRLLLSKQQQRFANSVGCLCLLWKLPQLLAQPFQEGKERSVAFADHPSQGGSGLLRAPATSGQDTVVSKEGRTLGDWPGL